MDQTEIERHIDGFSPTALKFAQTRTKQAVAEVSQLIRPGMSESESVRIMRTCLQELGARKFWHPVHVRFGRNTLLGYADPSTEDRVLQDQDIFFFDIGPVFDGYEGDYGATYTVGDDPLFKQIAHDVKDIFELCQNAWSTSGLTGQKLYDFCKNSAEERGWIMHPSYVKGHRISKFPHSLISKEGLANMPFCPESDLWILEVQIRHPTLEFGAFYEDLLQRKH